MTWYAHEIICQPTPEVLAELQAHPVLSQGLYWVKNLEDFKWFRPEIKHGLPPDGLLVVRPICQPNSHSARWYGSENPINWFTVPSVVSNQEPTANKEEIPQPPKDLRKLLRQLSYNTRTTVSFYQCEMWGGDIEFEKAWVYLPDETIYTHPITQWDRFGSFPDSDFEPLRGMLRHFGLELPTTYFALHTRGFPWARYKLPFP